MFGRGNTRSRNRRRDDSSSLARHILVGVGVCTFIALLTAGVWHVTRLPAFTIEHVTVSGGDTIPHESVRGEVESVLRGSYMKLIPYTFSFMYPKDSIASAIESMPRVKNVHVERNEKDVVVEFTEYTPFALWCLPQSENSLCYFLDETGYAFAPGPRLEGGALARHVREGETELARTHAFDEGAFSRTHALLARLSSELSLRVTDVLYTEDGDMKLTVNGGGELMLLADAETYDDAFENLISVLGSEEFRHIEPGNFKYIDLRFGNKIFVNEKLESDTPATSTEAVATTTEE